MCGLDSLGCDVVVLYLKLCFTLKKYSPTAYSRNQGRRCGFTEKEKRPFEKEQNI